MAILFNKTQRFHSVHSKILTLSALIALTLSHAAMAQNPLKSFKWEYRVIVVDDAGDASVEKQLKAAETELSERQLLWFVLDDSGVLTNQAGALPDSFIKEVKNRYFKGGDYRVILIGKDGGVKLRANSLDLHAVFDLVDSMPMRRLEMREALGE